MLNTTKVELEFIINAYTYLFFETGIRSGISYTSKRYSKSNNKYLTSYDPKNKNRNILSTQM